MSEFQLVEWNDALGTARPLSPRFISYADAEAIARAKVAGKRAFYHVSVHPTDRAVSRTGALIIVGGDR